MGASVSASHVIFMVAAIIAATAVGAAMIGIAFTLAEDISDKSDSLSERMGADIKIINDPAIVPYDGSNLSLYVLNTGDIPLDNESWIVIIDGRLVPDDKVVPQQSAPHFHGDVVELMVEYSMTAGDHTVMVRHGDRADDSMRFRL